MTSAPLVTMDDVRDAAERIDGVAHRTPVLRSRTLDELVGAEVFLKCENFQRGGAFKFRGAYNAVSRLPHEQLAKGVAAYSSGNHAQAVALAARERGTTAVILMPEDAPPSKLEATAGYGAEIVTYDRYTSDREALGAALAAERGLALIPPYDHPDVVAGQGTAALELLTDAGRLDMLVVPVGGGGRACLSALAGAPPPMAPSPAANSGWRIGPFGTFEDRCHGRRADAVAVRRSVSSASRGRVCGRPAGAAARPRQSSRRGIG